jgi:hypothetical protein
LRIMRRYMSVIRLFTAFKSAFALFSAVALIGPPSSWPSSFHVSTAADLRAALAIASENGENDVVEIATGTIRTTDDAGGAFEYQTAEDENFSLEVSGAPDGGTVLSGEGQTGVLSLRVAHHGEDQAADLILRRITVTKGNAPRSNFDSFDSLHTGSADITVADCVFIENVGGYGGVFNVDSDTGTIRMTDVQFLRNQVPFALDAGILSVNNREGRTILKRLAFIENSVVKGSQSLSDGSGGLVAYGKVVLVDSTFLRNVMTQPESGASSAGGGGAFLSGATIHVLRSRFEANSVQSTTGAYGGGLAVESFNGRPEIAFNTIVENSVFGYGGATGGGLAFIGAGADIVHNTIAGNEVRNGTGGGFSAHLLSGVPLALRNNIIRANEASRRGGDIYVDDRGYYSRPTPSPVHVTGNDFSSFWSVCEHDSGCEPQLTFAGNLDVAPGFANAPAGDFHLGPHSAVVDRGLTEEVPANARDADGDPYLPHPDIGADERVTCLGRVATIHGRRGPDVIFGTPGDDVIRGLAGDDRIRGLGGDDTICGGSGADTVSGGSGFDECEAGGSATDRARCEVLR